LKTFSELGLSHEILEALKHEGYEKATPIQAESIPPLLAGRDMLGCAQTGTGKTAAFALPILDRLMQQNAGKGKRQGRYPRVLVLSPTRELATQIVQSFATYGRNTGLVYAVVFGGVSQFHQVRALRAGVDVLVATPGRLIDLLEQGVVNLSEVRTLVLDEADRMLDMGFIMPIKRIVSNLSKDRQTMLFSATMPREIMHLADALLRDPVKVSVTPPASTAELIDQKVYMVARKQKLALLEYLLQNENASRAVVFTKTKHGAEKLSKHLRKRGILSDAIHGNKGQGQRQRALEALRSGKNTVLVATDVAARGLDVDGISHVFNFDMPMEPESYVHRIGRTGRAGAAGIAISLVDYEERGQLRGVERLTGKKIEVITRLPDLSDYVDRDGTHNGNHEERAAAGRDNHRPARVGHGVKSPAHREAREAREPLGSHAARPARSHETAHAGHAAHGGKHTPVASAPAHAGTHDGRFMNEPEIRRETARPIERVEAGFVDSEGESFDPRDSGGDNGGWNVPTYVKRNAPPHRRAGSPAPHAGGKPHHGHGGGGHQGSPNAHPGHRGSGKPAHARGTGHPGASGSHGHSTSGHGHTNGGKHAPRGERPAHAGSAGGGGAGHGGGHRPGGHAGPSKGGKPGAHRGGWNKPSKGRRSF